MSKIDPYLFLNGRADEAIAFYRDALGAELAMRMSFGESPEKSPMPLPPGWDQKVMHAALQVGDTQLMLSDADCADDAQFKGFRFGAPGKTKREERTGKRSEEPQRLVASA